jgi:hypothetical protein
MHAKFIAKQWMQSNVDNSHHAYYRLEDIPSLDRHRHRHTLYHLH